MHEGGIREPMIVKWPGQVAPKSKNDEYLIIEYFFPTILEMANIEESKIVQEIDGISFIPALEGKENTSNKRPLFWHYPNQWGPSGPGIGTTSAVRLGDCKLIYYHVNGEIELFNIAKDIGETTKLVSSNVDKAKELATVLSNYLIEAKAQMPKFKSTGKQVPYPIKLF